MVGDVELLWDGPLYFMTPRPQYGPPPPPEPKPVMDKAYLELIGASFILKRLPRKNRPGSEMWAIPPRSLNPESVPDVGVWYRVAFLEGQLASLEMVRPDHVEPMPRARIFRYLKDGQVYVATFNEYGALIRVEATQT